MSSATKSYLGLLREIQQGLTGAGKPTAEARWILRQAGRLDEQQLAARLMEAAPPEVEAAAGAMLSLRQSGYPLQLLLGETEFYGLRLEVERGVLIPRPETEGLVELALGLAPGRAGARVLDVGTGTGAIALAYKSMRPKASVWATDTSSKAVALARRNAQQLGLEVNLLQAPYTAGLFDLDLILSNPPYLPESYRQKAPPELAYEEDSALYSGPEGLDMARELLPRAGAALRPGGWLLLELAPENIYTLLQEAIAQGWCEARVLADLAQRPRYLVLRHQAK
jgi:release factor glutamine methyltransferase